MIRVFFSANYFAFCHPCYHDNKVIKGQETQCLAHKTIDSQGSFLLAKVLNVV
jgi:hypothetical protein